MGFEKGCVIVNRAPLIPGKRIVLCVYFLPCLHLLARGGSVQMEQLLKCILKYVLGGDTSAWCTTI